MSGATGNDELVLIPLERAILRPSKSAGDHEDVSRGYWNEPARIRRDLLDEFAGLADVMARPFTVGRGSTTGGFAPTVAAGDQARRNAAEFAKIVGDVGRELAARLVGEYWLCWPWFVSQAFQVEQPELYAAIEAAFEDGRIGGSSVAYNALMYAAMDAQVLYWGGWQQPRELCCRLCNRGFPSIQSHPRLVKAGLGYSYCGVCAARTCEYSQGGVLDPVDASLMTLVEMSERLQKVADVLGYAPSRSTRVDLQLRGLDPELADRLVCAFMTCPEPLSYLERFGGPWTRVLVSTGVVDGARPTARGTMSIARDGHLCRSLAERLVDDFMDSRGIGHESEPPWPLHKRLNPNGRMRADWKLADGTFVEYAGLAGDAQYDAKMKRKIELASCEGIPLILLLPHHLGDLHRVFRSYTS